jgi:dihydrofolate reductase
MKIAIIAAIDENGAIGKADALPWHLPDDLRRFAQITKGHAVLMGRKTHESILTRLGHPLANRLHIVLTHDAAYSAPPECKVVHTWQQALVVAEQRGAKQLFVIGGVSLYKQALGRADIFFLTRVHAHTSGDVFFPKWERGKWRLVKSSFHPSDERNEYDMTFEVYQRVV